MRHRYQRHCRHHQHHDHHTVHTCRAAQWDKTHNGTKLGHCALNTMKTAKRGQLFDHRRKMSQKFLESRKIKMLDET